jgi:hypothetical protein
VANLQLFPEKKVAWVVVPKAACTTIKWALHSLRGEYERPSRTKGKDKAFHDWFGYNHVELPELTEKLRSLKADGWTTFTVVRDPYQRFCSLYANILRRKEWKGPARASIEEFARHFHECGWPTNVHGCPQTDLIGTDLSLYDFVGRMEDMPSVFAFLRETFGIEDMPEERLNASPALEGLRVAEKRLLLPFFEKDYEVLPYEPSTEPKRVIAYSLYKNKYAYTRGILENCERARRLYPGWEVHVWTDGTTKDEHLDLIRKWGGIVHQVQWKQTNGVFLRFLAARNSDIFVSRDADDRLSIREVEAVQEWLESGKPYHIMHDHYWHRSPVMAGMLGVRSETMPDWFVDGLDGELGDDVYADQRYLSQQIWEKLLKGKPWQFMEHHGNGWRSGYERPFPSARCGSHFVGDSYFREDNTDCVGRRHPLFVYLVQTDKDEAALPFKVPDDADLFVLQWKEGLDPGRHGFYFPSAWSDGRNELFRRACAKMENYEYFIFMDDDVHLDFDLELFQTFLLRHRPLRATPLCYQHNRKPHPFYRDIPECCMVKYCENMLVAYHKYTVRHVMPYTNEHDTTNWWLTCEDMCERFHDAFGVSTAVFGAMRAYNLEKRDYPREAYHGLPEQVVREAPPQMVKEIQGYEGWLPTTADECHYIGDQYYHAGEIAKARACWERGTELGNEQCKKNLEWSEGQDADSV